MANNVIENANSLNFRKQINENLKLRISRGIKIFEDEKKLQEIILKKCDADDA